MLLKNTFSLKNICEKKLNGLRTVFEDNFLFFRKKTQKNMSDNQLLFFVLKNCFFFYIYYFHLFSEGCFKK